MIHVEARIPALLKRRDARRIQRELPRRQHLGLRQLLDRALRFRIEAAQRIDALVQQIDPQGQGAAHRVQVQQRAAHGELAVLVHRLHAAVAAFAQGRPQRRRIQHLPFAQRQTVGLDIVARGQTLHQRRHRRQQQSLTQRRQARQRTQTRRHDVLMR